MLSGNELSEVIDQLIEMNQQITLDLNEMGQDTGQGVAIEEQLEALVSDIEDKQEQNGFLSEQDIADAQAKATEQISKVIAQEKARD